MFFLPTKTGCAEMLLPLLIWTSGLVCNLSLAAYSTHIQLPAPKPPAVSALQQLISDFYARDSESFTISTFAIDRCARSRISDFMNELLFNFNMLKVTIESQRADGMLLQANRKSNVIIIDGLESLELLDPAALTHDFDINEHYFVYLLPACVTATRNTTSSARNCTDVRTALLAYFWQHYIINVSLLLDMPGGTCALYTFFPFASSDKCKSVTVRRINRFVNGWLHSGGRAIFPPKINNLQRCPLKVAVWDTPPYLSLHRGNAKDDAWQVGDFEGTLLLELAKKLNFTIELVVPPNDEQRGKRFPNGTTTGAINMLQNRLADLSLGSFRYTLERSRMMTGALPYYQTWQVYIVLQAADAYTSLEILTFAFDNHTWLCLGLSLQLVALLGSLLHRFRRRSRFARLMLGQPATQFPIANAYASFFGSPLVQMPWNTFTRFVLILWVIYGVLLRIAYQSLLLKLLQTNQYRKPPGSLSELVAARYTLVMTQSTKDSVSIVPTIQAGLINVIVIANSSELATFPVVDAAPAELPKLLAAVSPLDFLTYYVNKENKRGIFHIVPEHIFTQFITMYFTKHSYLIERFEELFMFLRNHGLIKYWAQQSLDTSYMWDKQVVSVKSVTLTQISGVFFVCLTLLAVAFCVFCAEIVLRQLKERMMSQRRRIPTRRRNRKGHRTLINAKSKTFKS